MNHRSVSDYIAIELGKNINNTTHIHDISVCSQFNDQFPVHCVCVCYCHSPMSQVFLFLFSIPLLLILVKYNISLFTVPSSLYTSLLSSHRSYCRAEREVKESRLTVDQLTEKKQLREAEKRKTGLSKHVAATWRSSRGS